MIKNILILCLSLISVSAISQKQEALQKIEAAKIALITERLELTPEQAEKFWPIYREYGTERKEIRQNYKSARENFDPNTATEEENRRMLELANQSKEEQLKLEQEYSQRVLGVIDTRQLNNLRKAESDFKEMLLKRIRSEQMRRQQQRLRNDERLNNRRN